MKTKHKLSALLFTAGVLFLIAAPQYAKVTYAAPGSPEKGGFTSLEFVFGLPAGVFCITGLVCVVWAVIAAAQQEGK